MAQTQQKLLSQVNSSLVVLACWWGVDQGGVRFFLTQADGNTITQCVAPIPPQTSTPDSEREKFMEDHTWEILTSQAWKWPPRQQGKKSVTVAEESVSQEDGSAKQVNCPRKVLRISWKILTLKTILVGQLEKNSGYCRLRSDMSNKKVEVV